MKICVVAKFFSWTIKEVRELASEDFERCYKLIPAMKAEETLRMITATSFPNAKEESRKKTHRELYREMKKFEEPTETLNMENLAQMLSTGGR